ncbi:MAG: S1 RNA-binding domain-containing protein [Deltaproteobacteria bacterium]|nr:S1 RNA-binding domain-containing protein [Deltaproteobacteria bacterium]
MESDIITGITSSDQLERKMHLKGKVVKTTRAGAIVDIGVEKPALLHVSQIVTEKDEPLLKVEETLKENDEVEVYVRNIRDDRIEVSMKKPLPLEWREIEKGMVVKGKVTEIEKYGAFVDIGAERLALVHISELSHGYVKNTSDVVKVGDEIEAKVIDFNRRRKQIKLSIRELEPGLDEIEGVKVTPARKQRKKPRKETRQREQKKESVPRERENEPTFMEIAMKEAMEKAELEEEQKAKRSKKQKKDQPNERDELLSRTLKHRF